MDKKDLNPESVLRRMESMMGGSAQGNANEHAAQELVYESWECRYAEDIVELLEEALELDPTNIDAQLGIMDCYEMDNAERIDALRELKEKAADKLGKNYFKNDGGHFWGVLETRPYMRVCNQLALRLMEMEEYEDSAIEHENMLKLNPNDNQGVRYGLVTCYLVLNRIEDTRKLFDNYKDDMKYSAIFAWARVLERFISEELKEASGALTHAREVNGYVMAYVLGHRKLPKDIPGAYSPGSREEAMIASEILMPAWKIHPEALKWLKNNQNKK